MAVVSRLALSWLGWGLLFACGSTPAAPNDGNRDATVVLSWNRDGGFAGFCDELKVTASGSVTASTCRTTGVKTGTLGTDDLKRLNEWRRVFGPISIASGDAGSADGMTLKLTLAGQGDAQPSDEQRQELLEWAQRVHAQTTR
jgi:hypothetical protein